MRFYRIATPEGPAVCIGPDESMALRSFIVMQDGRMTLELFSGRTRTIWKPDVADALAYLREYAGGAIVVGARYVHRRKDNHKLGCRYERVEGELV